MKLEVLFRCLLSFIWSLPLSFQSSWMGKPDSSTWFPGSPGHEPDVYPMLIWHCWAMDQTIFSAYHQTLIVGPVFCTAGFVLPQHQLSSRDSSATQRNIHAPSDTHVPIRRDSFLRAPFCLRFLQLVREHTAHGQERSVSSAKLICCCRIGPVLFCNAFNYG